MPIRIFLWRRHSPPLPRAPVIFPLKIKASRPQRAGLPFCAADILKNFSLATSSSVVFVCVVTLLEKIVELGSME